MERWPPIFPMQLRNSNIVRREKRFLRRTQTTLQFGVILDRAPPLRPARSRLACNLGVGERFLVRAVGQHRVPSRLRPTHSSPALNLRIGGQEPVLPSEIDWRGIAYPKG